MIQRNKTNAKQKLISMLLVNCNRVDVTLRCIESLRKNNYKNMEIIVVDNGSDEKDVRQLKKVKDIKLILLDKNIGYAKGLNIGAKNSKGDYIFFLNNDITLKKDALDRLIEVLESDKDIGIVNSSIIKKDWGKGKFRGSRYNTLSIMDLPIMINDVPTNNKEPNEEKFWASAGCSAYRRKDFKTPFDSSYFLYAEDIYFSWLARTRGKKIVFVPRSEIYHWPNSTTDLLVKRDPKMGNFFTFLRERNRLMNIFLFLENKTLLKVFPMIVISVLIQNIRFPKNVRHNLKAYFWFIKNAKKVLKKRERIQKSRTVGDNKVIRFMSCKFFDNKGYLKMFSILNSFAYFYCWTLGIKTREFYIHKK